MLESMLNQGLWLVVILSGVPLAFSSVTGLIVAVIQAATQIQEQSITYLVKFISLVAAVFFGGMHLWELLLRFLQHALADLALVR